MLKLFKKFNTRGRKREARQWLKQSDRICYRITFGDGPPCAGVDSEGRTLTQRCAEGSRAGTAMLDELRARDPILCEAVMEILWAEVEKINAMTPEEREARRLRRVERYGRAQRRTLKDGNWWRVADVK